MKRRFHDKHFALHFAADCQGSAAILPQKNQKPRLAPRSPEAEPAKPRFHDKHNAKGRVGLQTFGSLVRFENIRVTSPDGKVLWDGPPAIEASTQPMS